MKRKIVGIGICMLMFASVLSVAMPVNNNIKEMMTVCSPFTGSTETHSTSPLCQISSLLGKTVYGCNCYWINKTLVSFNMDNPGTINNITNAVSDNFLNGGCWVNGIWWCCEWSNNSNSNIWKINPATGEMTLVGPSGVFLQGLEYDDTTGIMYGCSNVLYTIDMFTGNATKIGFFGASNLYMIGIACDSAGNLYGEAVRYPLSGSLYSINKTTAKANLIGDFGLIIGYAQDMAFDKDEDKLYLAALTVNETAGEGALYYCDHHTAECTKIGNFPTLKEIDAFAIPYTSDVVLGIEIKGGLGVNAVITNTGTIDVSGFKWQLHVKGGLFGIINKTITGTVDIKAGESQTVSTGMLFGFGGLSISARVAGFEETATGTQLIIFSMVKK